MTYYVCSACGGFYNAGHYCPGPSTSSSRTYIYPGPAKSDRQKEIDEAIRRWRGETPEEKRISELERKVKELEEALDG